MRACSKTVRNTVLAFIDMQMVLYMKENGKMISSRAMASTLTPKKISMKVSFK
jgi:hypothetical protein